MVLQRMEACASVIEALVLGWTLDLVLTTATCLFLAVILDARTCVSHDAKGIRNATARKEREERREGNTTAPTDAIWYHSTSNCEYHIAINAHVTPHIVPYKCGNIYKQAE